MISQQKKRMSPKEYLEFEQTSDFRHEYFNGELFAMTGATKNHNWISSNIVRSLGNRLAKTPCMVFSSDMRVKIEKIEKYTYPDIVVACDDMIFLGDELDSLINPLVIIEILSDSTEAYDRGMKFEHYRLIESLQEYILISQHRYLGEKFKRGEDGIWLYSSFTETDSTIGIDAVQSELPLSEIYHRVEFEEKKWPE